MSEAPLAPPPPPETRSLSVVLRDALTTGEEVRLIVAKALADTAGLGAAYLNVEIEGLAVVIPKLASAGLGGSGSGYPVYVLATKDFMVAVGAVSASAAGGGYGGEMPIGGIIQWPTSTAPPGFLVCNGAGFSAVTYPLLAAVLGGTNLPDLRRRVPVGSGSGFGVGASDGLAEGSRGVAHHHRLNAGTDSQGSHQHGNAGTHQHGPMGGTFIASTGLGLTGAAGTARYVVSDGFSQVAADGDHTHPSAGAHTHTVNADTSGGGPSDGPSFIVLNFIIRAQ
jgi:microcystin-dependent protein